MMSDLALPVAILAGGLATRLRPVTETIPKSLIPINGEPFIGHQLRMLRGQGATRVVVCAGFLGEMIREFAGDGSRFGLSVEYSFDGERLMGTGGALRRAASLLGDAFLVIYGDSWLDCDYRAVERTFLESGKPGLMTVFRNEGQFDSSNVIFEGRRIVRYSKKERSPAMRHIDYGLGALQTSALQRLPADAPSDLAWLYEDLLAADQLAAFEVHQRFYEIGSFSGIAELERYLGQGQGEQA